MPLSSDPELGDADPIVRPGPLSKPSSAADVAQPELGRSTVRDRSTQERFHPRLSDVSEFQHFVITRFNLPWGKSELCLDAAWLDHRFELFEQFCLPSMRGQSAGNFTWLVFFHPATPDPYRSRITEYARWPNFHPVFDATTGEVRPMADAARRAIAGRISGNTSHVISTRLDNDDAVGRDFLATVQSNFTGQDFEYLNVPRGYIWASGRVYLREHLSNPFISLVEKLDGFRGVLDAQHGQLSERGRIRQLTSEPLWLQVVHGKNLLNSIIGTRVPRSEVLSTGRFQLALADDLPPENPYMLSIDRLVNATAKYSAVRRRLSRALGSFSRR